MIQYDRGGFGQSAFYGYFFTDQNEPNIIQLEEIQAPNSQNEAKQVEESHDVPEPAGSNTGLYESAEDEVEPLLNGEGEASRPDAIIINVPSNGGNLSPNLIAHIQTLNSTVVNLQTQNSALMAEIQRINATLTAHNEVLEGAMEVQESRFDEDKRELRNCSGTVNSSETK